MLMSHSSTCNTGFTLIEIMIAVLILSYGMLGIAGLQVAGIKNSHTASTQTIAALETSNLIARMRSNPEFWKNGNSDLDIEVSEAGDITETELPCTSPPEEDTETQTEEETEVETGDESENCVNTATRLTDVEYIDCTSLACNSAEMAKYNLQQWASRLSKKDSVSHRRLLPFQGATITKAVGMVTIQLAWLEEEARKKGRAVHSYQVKIKL